jgi:hypothetical protein
MFRSYHILFGAMLIAGIQTAAAESRTNVVATSAAPSAPSSLVLYFVLQSGRRTQRSSTKLPVPIAKVSRS